MSLIGILGASAWGTALANAAAARAIGFGSGPRNPAQAAGLTEDMLAPAGVRWPVDSRRDEIGAHA